MKKMKFCIGAVVLLMMLLISACAQSEKEEGNSNAVQSESDNGGVKEITLTESWDFEGGFHHLQSPNITNGSFGMHYFESNIYETLVKYKNGEIVPGLAEKWDISEDGKVYTFYLKEGIKFSDGTDFNAEAVKVNLDNVGKNLGEYNGSYGVTSTLIDVVNVIDDYVVEVTLTEPYYGAIQDFTLVLPMGMMSVNGYNEDGSLADITATQSLGTGPYMYAGDKTDDTYTFVRNPEYNRENADVDTFHVKIIPDNDAKALALRNGEVDLLLSTMNVSYDTYNELGSSDEFNADTSDTAVQSRTMGINTKTVLGKDKIVRKAINHAIDKESISKNIFYNIEGVAESVLDKDLPYSDYDPGKYDYDVEAAKKLLDENGWKENNGVREKNGEALTGKLVYISTSAMLDEVALAIKDNLSEIGIDITVEGKETMEYFQAVSKGDFDLALGITNAIPYDPYLLIYRMTQDPIRDNYLAQGLAGIKNADDLINRLNSMTDVDEIQKTYNTIITDLYENASLVPLTRVKGMAVYNKEVIESYDFSSNPDYMNVAAVKLK